MSTRKPSDTYSPLYFLASVGAGGLTVTFFMWLMFWIPHPGKNCPGVRGYHGRLRQWQPGNASHDRDWAVAGIAFFAFQNIKFLIWNLQRYGAWRKNQSLRGIRQD